MVEEQDLETTADVGAGTGVAGRDAGEEETPASLDTLGSGTSETTGDDAEWSAIAGEAMTEEGAAGGLLRDEPSDEEI